MPGRGKNKIPWTHDPRIIRRAELVRDLHYQGLSYRAIGEQIGVSSDTTRKDMIRISQLMLASLGESEQQHRADLIARQESIFRQAMALVPTDGAPALETARKAVMDIAKLYGLLVDKNDSQQEVLVRIYERGYIDAPAPALLPVNGSATTLSSNGHSDTDPDSD